MTICRKAELQLELVPRGLHQGDLLLLAGRTTPIIFLEFSMSITSWWSSHSHHHSRVLSMRNTSSNRISIINIIIFKSPTFSWNRWW